MMNDIEKLLVAEFKKNNVDFNNMPDDYVNDSFTDVLKSVIGVVENLRICSVSHCLIKPLKWVDKQDDDSYYPLVSSAFVPMPSQGELKPNISINDEGCYKFTATLWTMNGGVYIVENCENKEIAKTKAEEWWKEFVRGFLNCG